MASTIGPSAYEASRLQTVAQTRPQPTAERDWIAEGRDYQSGLRRCLPSVDLVLALMREIDVLQVTADIWKQVADERKQMLDEAGKARE